MNRQSAFRSTAQWNTAQPQHRVRAFYDTGVRPLPPAPEKSPQQALPVFPPYNDIIEMEGDALTALLSRIEKAGEIVYKPNHRGAWGPSEEDLNALKTSVYNTLCNAANLKHIIETAKSRLISPLIPGYYVRNVILPLLDDIVQERVAEENRFTELYPWTEEGWKVNEENRKRAENRARKDLEEESLKFWWKPGGAGFDAYLNKNPLPDRSSEREQERQRLMQGKHSRSVIEEILSEDEEEKPQKKRRKG
jgi:hypothetical protein